jgi:hypothetical protein
MAFRPWWDMPMSTTQNMGVGGCVRLLGLHLGGTSSGERFDVGRGVEPTVDLGPVDVVGGQAGQHAAAVVVVADPHHPGLARGH